MPDSCSIWLENAEITKSAGSSLASTLYGLPTTITLSGELGAGKTTFLQGFLESLGVSGQITSPTYALENWYETDIGRIISHIDLYRLNKDEARRFLEENGDYFAIRCIEWPERSNIEGDITIRLADDEKRHGRNLEVEFHDASIPSNSTIDLWRQDVDLPQHIIDHCEAVSDIAVRFGEELTARGEIVRLKALQAAGKLHDLLRFVDFREEDMQNDIWQEYRNRFKEIGHEAACAEFLREHNFEELADIITAHGLKFSPPDRTTIEQKLLYYADKRAMGDKFVNLDERFDDFCARYSGGKQTEEAQQWLKEAKEIEKELFPDS